MATEIEHKYLVTNDSYKELTCRRIHIQQGFLCREPGRTVRIRATDDKAYITIKGRGVGAAHPEFEYEIPIDDARQLLEMCLPMIIDKTRHIVMDHGNRWEVDEFHGVHEGLVMAELEIPCVDYTYPLPSFIGEQVTGDPRYTNAVLSMRPLGQHDD